MPSYFGSHEKKELCLRDSVIVKKGVDKGRFGVVTQAVERLEGTPYWIVGITLNGENQQYSRLLDYVQYRAFRKFDFKISLFAMEYVYLNGPVTEFTIVDTARERQNETRWISLSDAYQAVHKVVISTSNNFKRLKNKGNPLESLVYLTETGLTRYRLLTLGQHIPLLVK